MAKLYHLKYSALVSAERRRDKLAFYMEVTFFELIESRGYEFAEARYAEWEKEQGIIDEALSHVVGTCKSPKVEGKYWAIINDCINRVNPI